MLRMWTKWAQETVMLDLPRKNHSRHELAPRDSEMSGLWLLLTLAVFQSWERASQIAPLGGEYEASSRWKAQINWESIQVLRLSRQKQDRQLFDSGIMSTLWKYSQHNSEIKATRRYLRRNPEQLLPRKVQGKVAKVHREVHFIEPVVLQIWQCYYQVARLDGDWCLFWGAGLK